VFVDYSSYHFIYYRSIVWFGHTHRHPLVRANWLASPPLIVAFAIAGTTSFDLTKDTLGNDNAGNPVYLNDLWPTHTEIARVAENTTGAMFHETYANIFTGTDEWQSMKISESQTYTWQPDSTYIQHPPFFDGMEVSMTY
jgi:aconitate hydratase A / 2-methylisocitrate dehydratase